MYLQKQTADLITLDVYTFLVQLSTQLMPLALLTWQPPILPLALSVICTHINLHVKVFNKISSVIPTLHVIILSLF